jgi:hypothetical protein
MRKKIHAYRVLVEKADVKKLLESPRPRGNNNIEMDAKEIWWDSDEQRNSAQYSEK